MQQQQYVGIDLHRRRSVIVRMDDAGEVLGVTKVDNDPVQMAVAIAEAGPGPEVALETNASHRFQCGRAGEEAELIRPAEHYASRVRFVGKDEGVVVGRAPAPTDELGRFMLNGEHVVPMHPAARAAGFMAIDVAAAEAVVVHPPPVGREWFAVIDVDCVPRVEARACGHGQVTARRRSCVRARVQRAGQGQDRGLAPVHAL